MVANFNITIDGIKANPRLRDTPSYDQSVVTADVAFNDAQILAAINNLAEPSVVQTASGQATFARATITGASLSAVDSLRELFQSVITRESFGRG